MSRFSTFALPFRLFKGNVLMGVVALLLAVVVIGGVTGLLAGPLFAVLLGLGTGVLAGRATAAVIASMAARSNGNPIKPIAIGVGAVCLAFWLMPEAWVPNRLGFAAMVVGFVLSAGFVGTFMKLRR